MPSSVSFSFYRNVNHEECLILVSILKGYVYSSICKSRMTFT